MKKYIETNGGKVSYLDVIICNRGFRSYDSDILYRIQVNHVYNTYYRKKFKQNSISQYDKAKQIVVDDLHTIIDSICDFYS